MLLFSNYIIYSEIDGYGLFTTEDIKKGQEVWEFNPLIDKILSKEDIEKFPEYLKFYIYKYSISKDSNKYMLSLDNNRFTNHSNNPNVVVVKDKVVAARDIGKDEEITQKYGDFKIN